MKVIRAATANAGKCNSLTYNGASQTLAGGGTYIKSYSNNSGIDAVDSSGNQKKYSVTVTADDNHTFSGGATSTTLSCTIAKRATTCTSGSTEKVWDGLALTNKTGGSCTNLVSGHTATFSGHTGTITNVGSTANTFGSVSISSGSTNVTNNYAITKANGTLKVIRAATAKVGSCNNLTYNGASQTLVSGGTYIKSYGNNSQINAGTYKNIIATADDNHAFSGGAVTQTMTCSIAKATPTITLSATSGTLTTNQITFTEKANVAGKFTNASGTTSVAAVSPTSSTAIAANTPQTVKVIGVADGSSTITVNFTPTDTSNYNNAAAKTYQVTVAMSHTVTYNYSKNGGTSSTKTTASVNYGKAIDLTPTATKSGWTFVGWNTTPNATTGLNDLKMGTSNVELFAIYSKELTGTIYYYNSGIKDLTLKCNRYNTSNSCSAKVELDTFNTTKSQYGGSYVGYGKKGTVGVTNSSSIKLEASADVEKNRYYVSYRQAVKEYYQNTSRPIYRNSYFTSTTAMNTVLSTSNVGTGNLSGASWNGASWYGYGTSARARTYSSVSAAATSTSLTLYTLYSKTISVKIYYSSGSSAAALTASSSGNRIISYDGTTIVSEGTISIPSSVSSSKSPLSGTYQGVSSSQNSQAVTTTPTSAYDTYYAVYKSTSTVNFTKGNNVSSIGATTSSCDRYNVYSGSAYATIDCSVTLPGIVAANDYYPTRWVHAGTDDTAGAPNTEYTVSVASETLEARARRLTESDLTYNNKVSGYSCTDVKCAITSLYKDIYGG